MSKFPQLTCVYIKACSLFLGVKGSRPVVTLLHRDQVPSLALTSALHAQKNCTNTCIWVTY